MRRKEAIGLARFPVHSFHMLQASFQKLRGTHQRIRAAITASKLNARSFIQNLAPGGKTVGKKAGTKFGPGMELAGCPDKIFVLP